MDVNSKQNYNVPNTLYSGFKDSNLFNFAFRLLIVAWDRGAYLCCILKTSQG